MKKLLLLSLLGVPFLSAFSQIILTHSETLTVIEIACSIAEDEKTIWNYVSKSKKTVLQKSLFQLKTHRGFT